MDNATWYDELARGITNRLTTNPPYKPSCASLVKYAVSGTDEGTAIPYPSGVVSLEMEVHWRRKQTLGGMDAGSITCSRRLTSSERRAFLEMIDGRSSAPITLASSFPKFLRIPSIAGAAASPMYATRREYSERV